MTSTRTVIGRASGALLVALGSASAGLAAPAPYAVTDLGTVPGHDLYFSTAINQGGQFVSIAEYYRFEPNGNPVPCDRSFLHDGGSRVELPMLSGDSLWAWGLNNHGHVVGFGRLASGQRRAFVSRDSVTTELGSLGAGSWAFDINDAGWVVGGSERDPDDSGAAVAWSPTGQIVELPAMAAADGNARAINNSGQIVGWTATAWSAERACLWQDGSVQDLGSLSGDFMARSWAMDISEDGRIVGASDTPAGPDHAFLWCTGTMTDLGTLGGLTSTAYAVNELGDAVGTSRVADGSLHAALWRDGMAIDLNDRVPAEASWELIRADDINNAGWIVGHGRHAGEHRAFLLTPVPEPGAAGLLVAPALLCSTRRHRP